MATIAKPLLRNYYHRSVKKHAIYSFFVCSGVAAAHLMLYIWPRHTGTEKGYEAYAAVEAQHYQGMVKAGVFDSMTRDGEIVTEIWT